MSYFDIDRGSTAFIAFLKYLLDKKNFDASEIIDVVEKPWKQEEQYNKYMNEFHGVL